MTTHEERVNAFNRSLEIGKKLGESDLGSVDRSDISWLLSWFREYVVELDLTLIDLNYLKGQLNSIQSNNDKEKEDSYNE